MPITKHSLLSVDFRRRMYFYWSYRWPAPFLLSFMLEKESSVRVTLDVNDVILPLVSTLTFILGLPPPRPTSRQYSPNLLALSRTTVILLLATAKDSLLP